MSKYYVEVVGSYIFDDGIEADSKEEAIEIALQEADFSSAEFGIGEIWEIEDEVCK